MFTLVALVLPLALETFAIFAALGVAAVTACSLSRAVLL